MFRTAQLGRLAVAPVTTTTAATAAALGTVTRWPVESQQRARRNAMVAATALARRRAELEQVEEFLASRERSTTQEVAAHAARG